MKTDDCFHSTQKPILKSKYDKASLKNVITKQKHLMPLQRTELHDVLQKREKLFSGKLGYYPFKKMHLELMEQLQFTPSHILFPESSSMFFTKSSSI
jgi:hypothetical protein